MKRVAIALPLAALATQATAHGGHAAAPDGLHTLVHVMLAAFPLVAALTLAVTALGATRWRNRSGKDRKRRAP